MEKTTFNMRKGDNIHPLFTPGSHYATGPPMKSTEISAVTFKYDDLVYGIF